MAVDEMMHHQRYKQSAFLSYKAGRTVRDPSIDYVSTSMCIGFSEALGEARKPKPADDSKASLSAPAGEPGKPEDVLILIQNQSETLHIPHSAPKLRHETPQQTYTCKGRLLGTKLTNLKKAPTQPNNPNKLNYSQSRPPQERKRGNLQNKHNNSQPYKYRYLSKPSVWICVRVVLLYTHYENIDAKRRHHLPGPSRKLTTGSLAKPLAHQRRPQSRIRV